MTTGQNIRAARKAAGLTQKQLAQKLGCTNSLISNWENDYYPPESKKIKKMAEIFACNMSDLESGEIVEQKEEMVKSVDDTDFFRLLGYRVIDSCRVDYIQALRALEKNPNDYIAQKEVEECEYFFRHEFCMLVDSEVDGESAIDALKRFAMSGKMIPQVQLEPAHRKEYEHKSIGGTASASNNVR